MAVCEMCGKEANLVNSDVEGVELKLCPGCSKYGLVKKKSNSFSVNKFTKKIFTKNSISVYQNC